MTRAWPSLAGAALAGAVVIANPHCGGPPQDHGQEALALLASEHFDEALSEARRALRQDGPSPQRFLVEALALAGADHLEESLQALQRGLVTFPEDARLHKALQQLCAQFGLFRQAQPLLSSLLEQHPESPSVEATLGWVLTQVGEEERGQALLQQSVDQAGPTFAFLELSRILQRQERPSEAAAVLEQALEQTPEDADLLLALGQTRLSQGVPQQAHSAFDRAVSASDEPGETASRVAQLYYELGDRGAAIQYYERALTHLPDDATLLNNLAWTYAEARIHLDRAASMALQAVKQSPDNVVYLDTYAEVLYRTGHAAKATALTRRALSLEPLDGQHYAYLRGQLGRFSGVAAGSAAGPP